MNDPKSTIIQSMPLFRSKFGGFGRICFPALLGVAAIAAGCSQKEVPLTGQRFDIRMPLSETRDVVSDETDTLVDTAEKTVPNEVRDISLEEPADLDSWTHVAVDPTHKTVHAKLSPELRQIWSVPIGEGNSRRSVITATPVVAGDAIFTMDSKCTVMAHTRDGQALWSESLVPPFEGDGDASSGGLAYWNGRLFATTGFGALHSIDPASGAVLWTQKFGAAANFAPTVADGIAYVVTADSKAWAVDVRNGRVRWRLESIPAAGSVHSDVAPAVAEGRVYFPFSSGEIIGASASSGEPYWSAKVAGIRVAGPRFAMRGVSSPPVVDGGVLYAANQSGKMSAINTSDGKANWTADEGAYSAVVPAGDSVFLVSDAAELVRLDASTGRKIWAVPLPEFKRPRARRKKAVFANYGPVLVGGRLIVASSDGFIRHFEPESGTLIGTTELPSGASSGPVVVDGVLYLTTDQGRLLAFR